MLANLPLFMALAGVLVGAGCNADNIDHGLGGGPPRDQIGASGPLVVTTGHTAPSSAKVMVMWTTDEGGTARFHKFGEGVATPAGFQLEFTGPPPASLLFGGNVGVGVPYLVPDTTVLADGPVDDSDIKDVALGAAGNYAIVYRKGNPVVPTWISSFVLGYSCAIGLSSGQGGDKRSFAPTNCNDVRIEVDELGGIQFVEWR